MRTRLKAGTLQARASGAAKRATSRAVTDLPIWLQAPTIGGRLTPNDISQVIRCANAGDPQRLMDLANDSRQKDCHLQAVLAVCEESIGALPWRIVVDEDARAKDKRAAKWIEQVLRGLVGFRRLLTNLAGSIFYGYDVNEILWKKAEGKLVPSQFFHLAHRRFGWRAADALFVLRDYGTNNTEIDFLKDFPRKFIVSHPRVNGDAPQREGLARPLIWMSHFRRWTIGDWLQTAELSWKPWRIGSYAKLGPTAHEDRDGLEEALQKLSTSGWAVKPDNTTIDIEWPKNQGSSKSTHYEFARMLADEMSKAVLGQTETTQSSSSSGYAQAKVHNGVKIELRNARAQQIAEDITRDLITSMIELNFDGVRVPKFEFITDDPLDLVAFSEAISKLAMAQLKIPQEWVRTQANIPEPKDEQDIIGGPAAKPPSPFGTPTSNEPNGPKPPEADPAQEEPKVEPVKPKPKK